MKNRLVPGWLIKILIIVVLLLLIGYFSLSDTSKWEDLLLNLAIAIIGIVITLSFVDVIINKYESKKWLNLKTRILDQLVEILKSLYNFIFINYANMNTWIEVQNDIQKTNIDKIKELERSLCSMDPSIDYINSIKKDDHLIEFFSNGYSGNLKRLNEFFRLYHLRLSHQESPLIIDLQSNLSTLVDDLNLMKMDKFLEREFNPANDLISSNKFSNSLQQTADTITELTRTLVK
jgi:hypothetical protein